jgi:hypothetical protein
MTTTHKAVQRILDSVWTLAYQKLGSNKVKIISYDRHDSQGYDNEKTLPHSKVIESDDGLRTVKKVLINGDEFIVANPQYIFSY